MNLSEPGILRIPRGSKIKSLHDLIYRPFGHFAKVNQNGGGSVSPLLVPQYRFCKNLAGACLFAHKKREYDFA